MLQPLDESICGSPSVTYLFALRINLGIFSDGLRSSLDVLCAICNETGNYQFISTSAIIYSWRECQLALRQLQA
ncbi:hypothetical protein [Chamaesiphon sp. OTE_20_metabat_361]|uniref:hypothetical protein n=1 Tax=Chamaesiphon sp. OTE_20_metabat_361 TaxID=2964689 RepID=UPI00286A8A0C|nr:hypothetical protein [Chamaesiphon sp. OTE_20_metabat_361]